MPAPRRGQVIERLTAQIRADPAQAALIPERFWSARPAADADDGGVRVAVTGAVLVRCRGRRAVPSAAGTAAPLAEAVAASLHERPARPARELARQLRADPAVSLSLLAVASAMAAAAVVIEALLFRGALDISRDLGVREQRLGALAALLVFTALVLAARAAAGVVAAGRRTTARDRAQASFLLAGSAARRSLLPQPSHLRSGRTGAQPAAASSVADARGPVPARAVRVGRHHRGHRLDRSGQRAAGGAARRASRWRYRLRRSPGCPSSSCACGPMAGRCPATTSTRCSASCPFARTAPSGRCAASMAA